MVAVAPLTEIGERPTVGHGEVMTVDPGRVAVFAALLHGPVVQRIPSGADLGLLLRCEGVAFAAGPGVDALR